MQFSFKAFYQTGHIIQAYFLMLSRLVKEQMETGKSQETLDSVGLQSSSVKEVEEPEDGMGQGDSSLRYKRMWHI